MGFRITTNMMINTYRYNLMNSTNKLSDARDKVLTQRNFNSYAEDPASASLAFRLRRQWYQTSSQLANTDATYNKFHTAWTNLGGIINDMSDANGRVSAIRGNSDPLGESRSALAQVLRETADSVVQSMNQKVGEEFIFAGNDGLNVPFSWSSDGTTLYYRGINVNAGGMEKPTAPEPDWLSSLKTSAEAETDPAEKEKAMGWYQYYAGETDVRPDDPADPEEYLKDFVDNKVTTQGLTANEEAGWLQYYARKTSEPPTMEQGPNVAGWGAEKDPYGYPADLPKTAEGLTDKRDIAWYNYYSDKRDVEYLDSMAKEKLDLDMGMGLKEVGGKLVNGSAFDSALRGVSFLNYGVDEDGDPKSLPLVMKELADVFQAWDEDSDPQGYNPELAGPTAKGLTGSELQDKAYRLMDKLNAAQAHTTEMYVELDAKSSFLKTNSSRLSTEVNSLNEQVLNVEQVDLADAITQFSWDQYCYNAALKIGNQLLSESLIDYMR